MLAIEVDAASISPSSDRMDIVGYVEDVIEVHGARALKGWAFDRSNPDAHVALSVTIDDQPLDSAGDVLCDVQRIDLAAAGMHRSDCGFIWVLPDAIADGARHDFAVRAGNGSTLALIQAPSCYDTLWHPVAPEPELVIEPEPEPAPLTPHQSVLFDAAYYMARNPGVVAPGETAWGHFLRIGASELRNPNPLFDIRHYLQANPGLLDLAENPLLHFDRVGRAAGLTHHWLFDGAEYMRLNPDLPKNIDALYHILAHGLTENRQPASLFDPLYYLHRFSDVARAGIPALTHFLESGDKEGRAPHPLFDPAFYAQSAGDTAGLGLLEHYVQTGGRANPHPLFDQNFYRSLHNDPEAAAIPPLLHYLKTGATRLYSPHPAFDPAHYLRASPEPEARADPLTHYITTGMSLGRSPHPLFDPAYYTSQPARRSWDGRALPVTGPRISVIVPVYNTPAKVLTECIDSVLRQTYASWELCIVDDGSRSPGTASALAAYRNRDPRIRIDRTTANLHIARATNRCVMQASGEFLAFLDHDDTLEPEALAEIAAALMADPEIDLLYTDEDKLDLQGNRTQPYYKPDWSPDHLNSVMYVLHMLVVRKSLFWAVGGSRPERTGAQDYDLALRIARRARRVHHVPRILYHWRMMEGSVAGDLDAKPYALEAGRAALQDAVDADGLDATVVPGLLQGTFRVRPRLATKPPVTLLILTNDRERDVDERGPVNLVQNFLRSIAEKSTYTEARIVIVDDANSSVATKRLAKEVGAKIVPYRHPGPFSYAHKANFATQAAKTEHIIYLNDDMEVITPDWIQALLELSTRDQVGGVGARLLYPDGRIQHAGVVLGVHGAAGHAFLNLERETVGYNAYTHVIRNYSAVTGAVFATRRSVIEEVGGYDERLALDFNDIDLCLRIGKSGRRIAYTPFCELYHFEGSSAVRTTQAPAERALFLQRWASLVERDPYYSPSLPRDRLGFA